MCVCVVCVCACVCVTVTKRGCKISRLLCQIEMFRLTNWPEAPLLFYELLLNGIQMLFLSLSICRCVSDRSSSACVCVSVVMGESGYLQVISHRVATRTQDVENKLSDSSQKALPLFMRSGPSSSTTWLY